MKILHILDSLEINGGSIMCLELLTAMKRIFNCQVDCLVVSKTGKYGRKNLTAEKIASHYDLKIPSIDYEQFKKTSSKYKDYNIIQHRLECTRPLSFLVKPKKYIVINHTIQKVERIANFKTADVIVSVCHYLKNKSPKIKIEHRVILNGISKNLCIVEKDGSSFITGRCHRLPPAKFSTHSLGFLDSLDIPNHVHYIAGPEEIGINRYIERKKKITCIRYCGKIDNQVEKNKLIKSFDLYFYDTYSHEGASMAILEALAAGVPVLCKPLGGNKELVLDGVNGFYYNDFKTAKERIMELYYNRKKLDALKKNVEFDFDNRLSIDVCAKQYGGLLVD